MCETGEQVGKLQNTETMLRKGAAPAAAAGGLRSGAKRQPVIGKKNQKTAPNGVKKASNGEVPVPVPAPVAAPVQVESSVHDDLAQLGEEIRQAKADAELMISAALEAEKAEEARRLAEEVAEPAEPAEEAPVDHDDPVIPPPADPAWVVPSSVVHDAPIFVPEEPVVHAPAPAAPAAEPVERSIVRKGHVEVPDGDDTMVSIGGEDDDGSLVSSEGSEGPTIGSATIGFEAFAKKPSAHAAAARDTGFTVQWSDQRPRGNGVSVRNVVAHTLSLAGTHVDASVDSDEEATRQRRTAFKGLLPSIAPIALTDISDSDSEEDESESDDSSDADFAVRGHVVHLDLDDESMSESESESDDDSSMESTHEPFAPADRKSICADAIVRGVGPIEEPAIMFALQKNLEYNAGIRERRANRAERHRKREERAARNQKRAAKTSPPNGRKASVGGKTVHPLGGKSPSTNSPPAGKSPSKNGHGGARPGAGRPKGSGGAWKVADRSESTTKKHARPAPSQAGKRPRTMPSQVSKPATVTPPKPAAPVNQPLSSSFSKIVKRWKQLQNSINLCSSPPWVLNALASALVAGGAMERSFWMFIMIMATNYDIVPYMVLSDEDRENPERGLPASLEALRQQHGVKLSTLTRLLYNCANFSAGSKSPVAVYFHIKENDQNTMEVRWCDGLNDIPQVLRDTFGDGVDKAPYLFFKDVQRAQELIFEIFNSSLRCMMSSDPWCW